MKSIRIQDETHKILKEYCKDNMFMINAYADYIITEFIKSKQLKSSSTKNVLKSK